MSPARAALTALGAAALLLAGFEVAARFRPDAVRQDPEALHRAVRSGFLERLREAEATARCVLERPGRRGTSLCREGLAGDLGRVRP